MIWIDHFCLAQGQATGDLHVTTEGFKQPGEALLSV